MAWFGLKCSSFCAISQGSTGRSACASLGYSERRSVMEGDCLLQRTGREGGLAA